MGPHHGMDRFGVTLFRVIHAAIRVASTINVLRTMQGAEPLEKASLLLRKHGVGRFHGSEQRVAPGRGELTKLQHSGHGGGGLAGHVAVPAIAIGHLRIAMAVNDKNRVQLPRSWGRGMDVKLAKAAGKGRLYRLTHGRRLLLKEEHPITEPGPMNLLVDGLVYALSQVDATHLGS